jgi:hypothetical protein
MALVGSISLALGASLSVPLPQVHDEFSYLLAADTFFHGRATNPTHPLWVHFESFHIIHQPTYASKYPVGQGLALTAGRRLTGVAAVGVWLTIALAAMAISWMLLPWVPPRWALAGGLLAAIHPQVLRWDHSYWGGGVAMLGGALVIGSVRRLVERPGARAAIVMAVGLVILANSRPFEGLVLGVLAVGSVVWMLRARHPARLLVNRLVVPALLVLVPAGGLMGYHNWRVTGDPLLLPYALHEATYAVVPPFRWQRARPAPVYRHEVMRQFWTEGWVTSQTPGDPPQRSRVPRWLRSYARGGRVLLESVELNPGFLLALIGLPFGLRGDSWTRWAAATLALALSGILVGSWMQPHYGAPVVGLAVLVVVVSTYRLSRHRVGRVLVAIVWLVAVVSCAAEYRDLVRQDAEGVNAWHSHRARIAAALVRRGEPALVVVRYSPQHQRSREWVYNDADIDASPVVWAREMDPAQNARLFDYFSDRRIWLLEADERTPRLVPYPGLRL